MTFMMLSVVLLFMMIMLISTLGTATSISLEIVLLTLSNNFRAIDVKMNGCTLDEKSPWHRHPLLNWIRILTLRLFLKLFSGKLQP